MCVCDSTVPGQARSYIELGLEGLSSSEEHWWEPELYRLRGIVAQAEKRNVAEIERDFQKALTMATEREARALALRSATSAAELHLNVFYHL